MNEVYWYSDGGLLAQVMVLYQHPNTEGVVRVSSAFGEHYVYKSFLIPFVTDVSDVKAPYIPIKK